MLKVFLHAQKDDYTQQEIQIDVAAMHQSTVLKVERTSRRAVAGIDSQDI